MKEVKQYYFVKMGGQQSFRLKNIYTVLLRVGMVIKPFD